MLKVIFVILVLHGVLAFPDQSNSIQINKYENVNDNNGNYKYVFELSNGIQKEEVGAADVDASGNSIEKVKGSYAFYAPDGTYQRVEYTVDENGYRANFLNNFKESPLLRPTTGIPPVTDRLYIHGIPSLSGGKKEISGAAIKTLSG